MKKPPKPPTVFRLGQAKKYDVPEELQLKTISPGNVVIGSRDRPVSGDLIFVGKIIEEYSHRDPRFLDANVWFDSSRSSVIFVCGKRGSGKSYDLAVFAEGLSSGEKEASQVSWGNTSKSLIVFDPLDQFWTLAYLPDSKIDEDRDQIELLRAWKLEPFALRNIRIFIPPEEIRTVVEAEEFSLLPSQLDIDDWCGLLGVNRFDEPMGNLLARAHEKVAMKGYSRLNEEGPTYLPPNEDYDIGDLVECVRTDEEINDKRRGFRLETQRALISRLENAQRWSIFRGRKGVDIREVAREGQCCIFLLGSLSEAARGVVTSVIIKKLFDYRRRTVAILDGMKRARAKPKGASGSEHFRKELKESLSYYYVPSCWILIDEAHDLCPSSGVVASRDPLISLAKQGRKFGISMILATQQPSAVDDRLLSQLDMMIVHNLAFMDDIKAAERRLIRDPPQTVSRPSKVRGYILPRLLRSLEAGECLIACEDANRAFLAKIRPRLTVHGGREVHE